MIVKIHQIILYVITENSRIANIIEHILFVIVAIPTTWSTATIIENVTSIHYNSLSTSSPTFSRPNGGPEHYFYQAIAVTVTLSGNYRFFSNSSIDTYGYFYRNAFFASTPTDNLIAWSDDSAAGQQFFIEIDLQNNINYVLVITTYYAQIMGDFIVVGIGPSRINYTLLAEPTTTSKSKNIYHIDLFR